MDEKSTQNNYRYISLKTLIAKKSIARCNKYNTYFYITKFIDSLLYIVIYVYIYCQTLSSTPANVPVLLPIPSNAVNSGAGGARTHLPMFSDQERIKPRNSCLQSLTIVRIQMCMRSKLLGQFCFCGRVDLAEFAAIEENV